MSLCSQAELSYISCKSPLMAFCMHMPIFIYSYTGVNLHCSTIAIGLNTPFSLNKPRLQVSTRHHLRSCFSQVYTVQKAVQWPRSTLCSIIASMRKKLLKVCRNRCEQSTEKACCVGQQALTNGEATTFTHTSAQQTPKDAESNDASTFNQLASWPPCDDLQEPSEKALRDHHRMLPGHRTRTWVSSVIHDGGQEWANKCRQTLLSVAKHC